MDPAGGSVGVRMHRSIRTCHRQSSRGTDEPASSDGAPLDGCLVPRLASRRPAPSRARRDGRPDAEVKIDVRRRAAANVRFARNEITTAGESDEIGTTIWIALGQRHASTSVNQTDEASVRAAAGRALAMAKLSPEDPEKMPREVMATLPGGRDGQPGVWRDCSKAQRAVPAAVR